MTIQNQCLQTTQPPSGGAVTICCATCVEPSRSQQWGTDLPFLSKPTMRSRWMAGAVPHKKCDVEANPGPATLNKRVWICDICYKQMHVRKQISTRCNRIEHWVHLRCVSIRQAQYTDTWTCHLHRESRLTTHTDITPPDPPDHVPNPLPTPHLHNPHHRNQNTDARSTLPLFPHAW